MSIPLELQLKNFEDTTGAVSAVVSEKLAKIEQMCPRAAFCHVLVEQIQNPKHHHHSYHIRVAVKFPPHHEVVVTKDPQKGGIQEELLTTQIRDVFISARRQIRETMDKHQGKIKTHELSE